MNNNKMKLWLIIPVCAIVLLLGGTYAWYVWQTSSDEETIIATDTGYAKVFFDGGSDINGKLKPVSDKSKGMSKEITVIADKQFIEPISFNLYLDINSIDAGLKHESFKFELYKGETLVKAGNFGQNYLNGALSECSKNEGVNHILLTSDVVTTTEAVYTLYTWIDGNMSNPLSMESQNFDFTLHADGQHAILGEKGVEDLPLYANANFTNGLLAENARFESGGYTAVIPQGFKVIDGIDGTQSIAKGLVIQDQKGNEFVWIPVETKKDENSNDIDDGLEAFQARYNITDYTEPYTNGYTKPTNESDEVEDYNKMMASVQKNKGFYIGRYEAGIDPEEGVWRKYEQANPENNVVVQKGAYPYNYVAWGKDMSDYTTLFKCTFHILGTTYSETGLDQGHGAVYLSKHLLDGQEDIGATSTLCYGVQWDAMLNFIDVNTDKDINSSTSWGNYYDNKFTFTGKYSDDDGETWQEGTNKEKPEKTPWLLTTGASDTNQAQNIYDVAGNVCEWTMEAGSSNNRINRGGFYLYYGTNYSASNHSYNTYPYRCGYHLGFRPTLYITN